MHQLLSCAVVIVSMGSWVLSSSAFAVLPDCGKKTKTNLCRDIQDKNTCLASYKTTASGSSLKCGWNANRKTNKQGKVNLCQQDNRKACIVYPLCGKKAISNKCPSMAVNSRYCKASYVSSGAGNYGCYWRKNDRLRCRINNNAPCVISR